MSTPHDRSSSNPRTVRERLIQAADDVVRRMDVGQVTIEVVAEAAGVSRSTAYRQLGGREQMITMVAIERSRLFTDECTAVMAQQQGTFAKLEAAIVYLANELPRDPIMRELMKLTPAAEFSSDALEVAYTTLGPAIEQGQADGDIRNDLASDEIVRWTVEQLYLTIVHTDRSEAAAVRRVRVFLIPALSRHGVDEIPGAVRSGLKTIDHSLGRARDALSALQETLEALPSEGPLSADPG